MAENVPDPLRRNASIHAVFESLALLLGLVVVAVTIMADSTFHQLAALISFVVVFFLAKTLFEGSPLRGLHPLQRSDPDVAEANAVAVILER